jgi:hypothetical protein
MLMPDGRYSHTAVDWTDQPILSRVRLEAEILILPQQINVLRRNSPRNLLSDWFSLGCIASFLAL